MPNITGASGFHENCILYAKHTYRLWTPDELFPDQEKSLQFRSLRVYAAKLPTWKFGPLA